MSKLKPTSYDEFARKLIRAGFIPIRKSKHIVYYDSKRGITIPLPHKHPRDIPKGLLNKLIKEMKISRIEKTPESSCVKMQETEKTALAKFRRPVTS